VGSTPAVEHARSIEELAQRGTQIRRRETLRDKLARELEEHADEVVAAYLAGIRSDDPNRAYRAADAWISRCTAGPRRQSRLSCRRSTIRST
jgi:hypothetical protein